MSNTQCKISEVIMIGDRKTYSFEVTPNIGEDQLTKNTEVEPLFYSITWHATVHECRSLDIAPLRLANFLKRNNKNIMLHLSCNYLRKEFADNLLIWLQREGICNLFIILGEKYNADTSDFPSTQDLILYIRQKTADYFCIGVAAFPDREDKFEHLKDKIESGADFIITQAFFDIQLYANFLNKCRESGILVPILPGIFPFETVKELTGFLNLCKVHVTAKHMEYLENRTGTEVLGKLIKDLCTTLKVNHFHFFTLDNIERTLQLIKTANVVDLKS